MQLLCSYYAYGRLCKAAAGAVVGVLGVVSGAYTFCHLLCELTRQGLPDVVVAVTENELAFAEGL